MNKILLALVALTLLAGCGEYHPGDTYSVVVDSSAGLTLADDVVTAASMWEASVPVTINVSISDHCDAGAGVICVHAISHDALANRPGTNDDTWATTRPALGPFGREDGADIYIDTASIWPARLRVFTTHELGHAMGLEHTGKDTVMCPMNWCMADQITAADVAQWHDVRR